MSGIAFTVDIRDSLTPRFKQVREQFGPDRLNRWLATDLVNLTRSHLVALAGARHRGDAPRNFYARASSAVSAESNVAGITISIRHQGIAQRFFGGTINAKPGKALAIPARSEAVGRSPLTFGPGELRMVWPKGRQTGWLEQVGNILTGKGRHDRRDIKSTAGAAKTILYWLVRSVTQNPDPTVIPTESAFNGAIAIRVAHILKQSSPNSDLPTPNS